MTHDLVDQVAHRDQTVHLRAVDHQQVTVALQVHQYATTDPQIVEATMYPYLNCDETHQASLTTDDRDAICAVYPDDLAARG